MARNKSYVPAGYEVSDDDDFSSDYVPPPSLQSISTGPYGPKPGQIRIIKSLGHEAGIDKQDFDTSLDEEDQQWLARIKDIFRTYKQGPFVSQNIRCFYAQRGDLFEIVLKLFAQAPDNSNPKPNTLSFKLVKELHDYLNTLEPATFETLQRFIDDNVRMVAFNFFHRHQNLFPMVVTCYGLKDSKQIYVDSIRELIKKLQYKDACQIAQQLELFDQFTIHDFIIPLIFQDKLSVVESYLACAKTLQTELVIFFDKWLDHSKHFSEYTDEYLAKNTIPEINHSKLRRSTLKKLVKRFASMYQIPAALTPFLIEMHQYGMLKHLIEKRFVTKTLIDWDDFVKENVLHTSEQAIDELINACIDFNEFSEAAKWTNYYAVDANKYSPVLLDYIEGRYQPEKNDIFEPVDERPPVEMYQIDIEKVHLIDIRDNYYRMLGDLIRFPYLSFDAEWKMGESNIDLIQLASPLRVYLIDVKALCLAANEWRKLGQKIFNNEEILKLGFSQDGDIAMLKKSLPSLGLSYEKSTSYLDLKKVWKYMGDQPGFRLPFQTHNTNGTSVKQDLRQLVALCLGKPLDKSQQFSNWSRRPMTPQQISYAASDAYCLIDVYEVLNKEAKRLKIDLVHDYELAKKLK